MIDQPITRLKVDYTHLRTFSIECNQSSFDGSGAATSEPSVRINGGSRRVMKVMLRLSSLPNPIDIFIKHQLETYLLCLIDLFVLLGANPFLHRFLEVSGNASHIQSA
jgi:hypothetical protein